jgi:pilus assembly protein Flp/PilA
MAVSPTAITGNCICKAETILRGERRMNTFFLTSVVRFHNLVNNEEGQDLVEYALVVAIIALGATAAMGNLAGAISTAFGTISSTFTNAL